MKLDKVFINKYEEFIEEDVEKAINFCIEEFNNTSNEDILIYLGEAYMAKDNFKEAIIYIKRGIENNCENTLLAYNLLGEALFYMDLYDESKKAFKEVINIDKKSFFANIYLIDISIYEKNYILAEEIAEKLLTIDELNKEDKAFILSKLSWIQLRYLDNASEGYKNIKNALEIDKNCGSAYVSLGFYNLNIKNYSEAITSFKRAIELGEECDEIYKGMDEANKKCKNY
ncbi:tetratricopeptide repeat protein [Clostridium chauvoei]|uniref:Tetratricopeptide repeat protein n=2 Tax=Clostridium chauvoei TaxID=46867 RepID=A0ABD4RK87_9CLOT|nr:hypothetical protein [Clostridium chauvoei]ATD54998.1 hypothetical protein BTM20_07000 [Clostridium chauvoei]ATD57324.1 hypothetical protein BTM21_06055 [Clostridium chauvoei]MBX7281804.1 hypothetical protein [Clostridium chauvoei]MBX7284326.1 hypothetical protein [Clostridium chauvoei]MBX7286833.1 hypothetical protein [Clostridium chauvoei]